MEPILTSKDGFDAAVHQPHIDSIRATLGDEKFAAEWEIGQQFILDEATACALSEET